MGRIDRMTWRRVHAIRGATTVDRDEPQAIVDATRELLATLMCRNALHGDEIVSAIFSAVAQVGAASDLRAISFIPAVASARPMQDTSASPRPLVARCRSMVRDVRGTRARAEYPDSETENVAPNSDRA